MRFGVSPDKVHAAAKPTDCDFMRAPLGSKGCHYEAVVTAYDARGVLVDDSKPHQTIESVYVGWVKKTD